MNIFLRRQGLGLSSIRNIISKMSSSSRIFRVDLRNTTPQHNFAFNWGNVNLYGKVFQNVVNKPQAISEISNKGNFRKKLYDEGLAMLTTKSKQEVLSHLSSGKKFVIRPYSHFGGQKTYLVNNEEELNNAILSCGQGWYASEYIPKVAEYRIFVTQGRVVYVVQKIVQDTSAVAWNVHQGGHFENIRFDSWNLKAVKASISAFNLTSLDFGAVDIISDSSNNVYVLEINSAPAMTSEYWTECVAKSFDYIVNNGSERIGTIEERGGWRKFIHPCLSQEAQLPNSNQPRTEFRDVEITEEVTDTFNWRVSFEGVGRRVTQEVYNDLISQISDAILSGERNGTANITRNVTRVERREFEV